MSAPDPDLPEFDFSMLTDDERWAVLDAVVQTGEVLASMLCIPNAADVGMDLALEMAGVVKVGQP